MSRPKKIEGAPVVVDPRDIKEIERECFERFTGGHNFLNWHAAGRDEDGVAMLRCIGRGPIQDGKPTKKIQEVKITKEGLVYMHPKFFELESV
jgi:hypothetical protein